MSGGFFEILGVLCVESVCSLHSGGVDRLSISNHTLIRFHLVSNFTHSYSENLTRLQKFFCSRSTWCVDSSGEKVVFIHLNAGLEVAVYHSTSLRILKIR